MPIADEHIPYFWAIYKTGGMVDADERFKQDFESGMAFARAFVEWVYETSTAAWTFRAHTSEGFIPIGFVTGIVWRSYFFVDFMAWLPHAGKRNIYASAVNFINEARRRRLTVEDETGTPYPIKGVFEFGEKKDTPFWAAIARHGILHRVGQAPGIYPDGAATCWISLDGG